jgi:hypothetical protein
LFGLDTQLFDRTGDEGKYWDKIGADGGWHGDEVETKSVWLGGEPPGKKRKRDEGHTHADGQSCGCTDGQEDRHEDDAKSISRDELEAQLKKLNFEIYRGELDLTGMRLAHVAVKGLVRLQTDGTTTETHILNYAFGRWELTPYPSLDNGDLPGMVLRLTIMGERGEVAPRARRFAEALGARVQ